MSLDKAAFYDLIVDISYGKEAFEKIKLQLKPIIREALALFKKEIKI